MTAAALLRIFRDVVGLLLDIGVPAHLLRTELDDAAVKRANVVADAAEAAKFGGGG